MESSTGGGASPDTKLSGKALKKARRAEKVKERDPNAKNEKTEPVSATNAASSSAGKACKAAVGNTATDAKVEKEDTTESAKSPSSSKPKLTKAERRAIQESQRQAKALEKAKDGNVDSVSNDTQAKNSNKNSISDKTQKVTFSETASSGSCGSSLVTSSSGDAKSDPSNEDINIYTSESNMVPSRKSVNRQVSFFLHLPQYCDNLDITSSMKFNQLGIHPAFIRLGVKSASANGKVSSLLTSSSSNDHCRAFLEAVQQLLLKFSVDDGNGVDIVGDSSSKTFSREFELQLKANVSFLEMCRPLPVSTTNAIKFIKSRITNLSLEKSNQENLQLLTKDVTEYLQHKVKLSSDAIVADDNLTNFVKPNDNVLIYGYSSLVISLLSTVYKRMKSNDEELFSVTIVDYSPNFDGRKSLQCLEKLGVQCNYGLVTSVNYLMPLVSKVLIGAHALLGNGAVMSKAGTGLVLLSAKSFNKPVIVCCETFKFSEKIQTDSIVSNELLNPLQLINNPSVNSGRSQSNELENFWNDDKLNLLNCVYDVSPPSLVSMVISEVGSIPSLSVPIIYRWKCKDLQDYL